MTLDSILEGILVGDDDHSMEDGDVGGGGSAASASPNEVLSSSSACSSPAAANNGGVAIVSSTAGNNNDLPLDGIPCISIKSELPDSATVDIMVRKVLRVVYILHVIAVSKTRTLLQRPV